MAEMAVFGLAVSGASLLLLALFAWATMDMD
jgi:hypothetical protein